MDTQLSTETIIDWKSDFLSYVQSRGSSTNTVKAYQSDLSVFGDWFAEVNGEEFQPAYITSTDLRAYRQYCIAEQVKPATFNRRRVTLRVVWTWAVQTGRVAMGGNPFEAVKPLDEVNAAPKWLEEADYNKFVRQVQRNLNAAVTQAAQRQAVRDAALVALMLWAGLREGEVCGLEIGDIKIGERSGSVVVRQGKGSKRRTVPLNAQIREALAAWLAMRGPQDGPLFTGKHGEPYGSNGIQERVREIGEQARLGKITPHQLRHTFCRRTLVKNAQALGAEALLVVAELAGHARLDTTRRYARPGREDLADAVERI